MTTFYVTAENGTRLAGGKEFSALEDAIQAAETSIKRTTARVKNTRCGGVVAIDVMEVIRPGYHRTRAIVGPEIGRVQRRD